MRFRLRYHTIYNLRVVSRDCATSDCAHAAGGDDDLYSWVIGGMRSIRP